MRHAACRRSLLEGRPTPGADGHVARCPACADLARDLERVNDLARAHDVAPMPPALPDRIVERIRAARAEGVAALPAAPAPALRQSAHASLLRRTVALAAAAMLVAGVAAVGLVRRGAGAPRRATGTAALRRVLLVAADRTAGLGTARVRLDASADVTVRLPAAAFPPASPPPGALPSLPAMPDLSGLPPELRARMEEQWRAARESITHASSPTLPSMPLLPRELRFSAAVDGTGELVQPDRLHLRGTVRLTRTTPPIPTTAHDYELVVAGGKAYSRLPDGSWARVPGPAGPVSPLVLDPGAAAGLLRAPSGMVSDLGQESLDGERVRHFRFAIRPGEVAGLAPGSSWSADAWVGPTDHVLRKLTLTASASMPGAGGAGGAGVDLRTSTTLRLFDFGADVSVEPPPASAVHGDLPAPSASGAVLYPFDSGVSFSFEVATP